MEALEEWKTRAIQMKKSRRSFAYIAEHVDRPIADVRRFLTMHKENPDDKPKKFIALENQKPTVHKLELAANRIYSFGLFGDPHYNSKYAQITYCHQYYHILHERGILDVYNTGDLDDGEQMRPGHQYDCYTQGGDDHVAEIVKNYPIEPGMTTHFITGNHDASIYKRCGMDIGKEIASQREDMHYLGRDCARIEIAPHCILELRHPWDGTAYALSYKPQKMIEGMEADSKPNILAIGHYHKLEYLFYRNIHCFQTGCFQMQTPYTRGKGISVHMGGWIITVEVDKKGYIQRIVPEMIPFYKGIEDDYKNWR